MSTRFLAHDDIVPWLSRMGQDHRVIAPMREGAAVVFRQHDGSSMPELETLPSMPPKDAIFPQTEVLFRFRIRRDTEHDGNAQVDLQPTVSEDRVLIFGTPPCGARGFAVLDEILLKGPVEDTYYAARRNNAVLVSVACARPQATCFCHWTGGGPDSTEGTDILLTPVDGGYVADGVTEKGAALVAEAPFADATEEQEQAAKAVHDTARERLGDAPDLSDAPEALQACFADDEFWDDIASQCLSCGACTYLCPTCSCFNITDEANGTSGERLRTWDNCMSPMYTREASGHNPRMTKNYRLRNRIQHKFNYHPAGHGGQFGCVGCGRCVKKCPAGVDIRTIVLRAKEKHNA
ncbi:4Fe-4S dicluster domain-containing protein [Desulfobaculum sp.]|jgi:ferredoxin